MRTRATATDSALKPPGSAATASCDGGSGSSIEPAPLCIGTSHELSVRMPACGIPIIPILAAAQKPLPGMHVGIRTSHGVQVNKNRDGEP
jgi:hypothetical protein